MKYDKGWKQIKDEHDPSFDDFDIEKAPWSNYITAFCVVMLIIILFADRYYA